MFNLSVTSCDSSFHVLCILFFRFLIYEIWTFTFDNDTCYQAYLRHVFIFLAQEIPLPSSDSHQFNAVYMNSCQLRWYFGAFLLKALLNQRKDHASCLTSIRIKPFRKVLTASQRIKWLHACTVWPHWLKPEAMLNTKSKQIQGF